MKVYIVFSLVAAVILTALALDIQSFHRRHKLAAAAHNKTIRFGEGCRPDAQGSLDHELLAVSISE